MEDLEPRSAAQVSTTGWTLCVRLIRSFEHRNIKVLVLRNVSHSMLVRDFEKMINEEIMKSTSVSPPFKKHKYDCLKINSYAHGAKTSDTAITLDHDEDWILDPTKSLEESHICNETEISYFCRQDYETYRDNPQFLW